MVKVSIMVNEEVTEYGFSDGTIRALGVRTWFCDVHEVTMKSGHDCPWCKYDSLGPVGFEKWARDQR
jgi:hypothetical protein